MAQTVSAHLKQGKTGDRLVLSDAATMKSEILEHGRQYLAMLKAKDTAGMLPDDLNEMIRGFMPSRVILSALELNLFTAVGAGASAEQVAQKIGGSLRGTTMLLNALVSLKLLEKNVEIFAITPQSARFLADGSPDSAHLAQLHSADLWKRWSTLTRAVKTGTPAERDASGNSVASFIAAMDHNARGRAQAMAKAVGLGSVRKMLDLGGGSGAYSIAFAKIAEDLTSTILDQPEVLAITSKHIREAGLGQRIHTRPGDMLTAPLESNTYDLVLLSAICHMFSPEENRALLRRAHAALVPQGRLVISDFILEPDKTAPRFAALFSLNMLVNTAGGASYSEPEYRDWLKEAGFNEAQLVRMPAGVALMIAAKS
jgi:ubiquinone/menaquinone biosynthesis C-methylase UbiE